MKSSWDEADAELDTREFEEDSIVCQINSVRSRADSVRRTRPGALDAWARTDQLSEEELAALARILEIRGIQPRQKKIRRTCMQAAKLQPGMSALEVGCGTGIVTREAAQIVGQTGRIVGVDISEYMLDYAREIGSKAELSGAAPIEYLLGDARKLSLPSREFDRTMAVTLFSHIADRDPIIAELQRVTRPGGQILLFDQDYQTLLFDHSQPDLTRKILLHGADQMCVDASCGRKLPAMLVRAGLKQVSCWPFVYVEREIDGYLITIAKRFAEVAIRSGIVREEEGMFWLEELMHRGLSGTFLASMNYYFAFGVVEQGSSKPKLVDFPTERAASTPVAVAQQKSAKVASLFEDGPAEKEPPPPPRPIKPSAAALFEDEPAKPAPRPPAPKVAPREPISPPQMRLPKFWWTVPAMASIASLLLFVDFGTHRIITVDAGEQGTVGAVLVEAGDEVAVGQPLIRLARPGGASEEAASLEARLADLRRRPKEIAAARAAMETRRADVREAERARRQHDTPDARRLLQERRSALLDAHAELRGLQRGFDQQELDVLKTRLAEIERGADGEAEVASPEPGVLLEVLVSEADPITPKTTVAKIRVTSD